MPLQCAAVCAPDFLYHHCQTASNGITFLVTVKKNESETKMSVASCLRVCFTKVLGKKALYT